MYVGQVVHYLWRGRCHAAMITEFWEDQNAARLAIFEQSNLRYEVRKDHGQPDADQTFHTLAECPDVLAEDAPVVSTDDEGDGGEPKPTAKPRGRPSKAK